MEIAHPLALLILVPLVWATWIVGRGRLRRLPWLRALATLVMRLAIATLLVVALAAPRVSKAASGVHVVYVLDRSASIGAAGRRRAEAWIAASLRGRGSDDSASLVAFGAGPVWSGPLEGRQLPPLSTVDAGGTDIAKALRLALGTLPAERPSRLVLLSDGRQTGGDALAAAQEAAARGVPISTVVLAGSSAPDVALTSLDVPRYSRAGQHVTVRATLQASRPGNATLILSMDGRTVGQQRVALHAGANTFYFSQPVGDLAGVRDYEVRVQASDDAVPQNDALDAATVVTAAPRLLMLTGDPAESATLSATLRRGRFDLTVLPAARAPRDPGGYAGYDAAVLADVPGGALGPGAVAALTGFVHDSGHGLLVTGGPHSFAAGGYGGSPIEALLPVSSGTQARASHADVGIVLIIDKSGSMMDSAHGVTKVSMAQQAAVEAVRHLRPTDQYGILAFDDTTHTVVPFGPVGNQANLNTIRRQVLALQPFGDTVIYPAMRQAARWLFNSHLAFKHVVLMTDGQGETAQYLTLVAQMRRSGITLSTIAIGSDAEVAELRSWATAGGGRFYYTADPRDIPRLVVLETRISSGPSEVRGAIVAHQALDTPALRSLAGTTLPGLAAYNIAGPREGAQVVLQSGLGDPLLAEWSYGAGRVAAWTGGTAASWARGWLGQVAFWSDTVQGLLPSARPRDLQPELVAGDGSLQIGVDARLPGGGFANLLATRATVTGPGGRQQAAQLFQDAPGHYSGAMRVPAPGVYTVTLAQYDGGTPIRASRGAVAVPYPSEYLPGPPDRALLGEIAAAGSAPSLGRPTDAFSAVGLPVMRAEQDLWPLLALLALLLFPLDVAVRVLYTPPAPYDPRLYAR